MTTPLPTVRILPTSDGVPIEAVYLPPRTDDQEIDDQEIDDQERAGLAFVVAHGFTGSWQRPSLWRIANRLTRYGGVVCFDFRGHGRSGGKSTMGDRETRDVAVAVAWARELGYKRIAAVGFSMGASIVLRYAGLTEDTGGLAAVVSVSGPGRWYYRGTKPMRKVHWAVEYRLGRLVTRTLLQTRVNPVRWDPIPVPPADAAALIAPTPLLVVHGDRDPYFPVDHAHQIYDAAGKPKELWILQGYGHAESASSNGLIDRIGRWVSNVTDPLSPQAARGFVHDSDT
ncbi:MAG TPA: alpha/beta fold hydrolase [Streptosporangiaceae bacterium]|nr:alpha/beta fold hydrolase [Streptosporangiaceae bacterium]